MSYVSITKAIVAPSAISSTLGEYLTNGSVKVGLSTSEQKPLLAFNFIMNFF